MPEKNVLTNKYIVDMYYIGCSIKKGPCLRDHKIMNTFSYQTKVLEICSYSLKDYSYAKSKKNIDIKFKFSHNENRPKNTKFGLNCMKRGRFLCTL